MHAYVNITTQPQNVYMAKRATQKEKHKRKMTTDNRITTSLSGERGNSQLQCFSSRLWTLAARVWQFFEFRCGLTHSWTVVKSSTFSNEDDPIQSSPVKRLRVGPYMLRLLTVIAASSDLTNLIRQSSPNQSRQTVGTPTFAEKLFVKAPSECVFRSVDTHCCIQGQTVVADLMQYRRQYHRCKIIELLMKSRTKTQ